MFLRNRLREHLTQLSLLKAARTCSCSLNKRKWVLESCYWNRNKIFHSLDVKSGMLQLGTGWQQGYSLKRGEMGENDKSFSSVSHCGATPTRAYSNVVTWPQHFSAESCYMSWPWRASSPNWGTLYILHPSLKQHFREKPQNLQLTKDLKNKLKLLDALG